MAKKSAQPAPPAETLTVDVETNDAEGTGAKVNKSEVIRQAIQRNPDLGNMEIAKLLSDTYPQAKIDNVVVGAIRAKMKKMGVVAPTHKNGKHHKGDLLANLTALRELKEEYGEAAVVKFLRDV